MWGCNYWDLWAKEDGTINVDYGNKWSNFNGFLQLDWLLNEIETNPNSRRLLLSGWDPANLANLDLPCCHYMYQFYVRDGYLDMIWHQRSADLMVGVPSDAVFAATMLLSFARSVNLRAGKCTMILGDTHIYREHCNDALSYFKAPQHKAPNYIFRGRKHPKLFLPKDLTLVNYKHEAPIKFELKA
jgi:thymidylate synthase